MRINQIVFCVLLTVLIARSSCSNAQRSRAVDTSLFRTNILFGKMDGSIFRKTFRPDLYGKIFQSYTTSAFMKRDDFKKNNKNYHRCGWMYYKFENYCKVNNVIYNKRELKRYRRSATLSGFFYFMSIVQPFAIAAEAVRYSWSTGYTKSPQVFFKGKFAPLLWSMLVIEWGGTFIIKGRAEKRLRKTIFTQELLRNKI